MKNIFRITTAFLCFFLFTMGNCSNDDEFNSCREHTVSPAYETKFNLSVTVTNKDGSPYQGTVTYIIYKEYCDGVEAGRYEKSGVTNSNGYFYPSYISGYNFIYEGDRVRVYWTVPGIDYSSLIYYYDVGETTGETMITKTFNYQLQ